MPLHVTAKEIPDADYLTPGKLYEVVSGGEYYFCIVDDNETTIYCTWKSCTHLGGGNWERIEGMKYDVSEVNINSLNEVISGDADQLPSAFVWGVTPQGHEYWCKQSKRELPLDIPALKEIRRQYLADEEETPITEPAADPNNYAAQAAEYGICITVTTSEVSITYDGRK